MTNVKLTQNMNDWQVRIDPIIEQARLALGDNGRLVIRPSGTEPLVRVMVEASIASLAEKWAKQIADVITQT